MITRKRTFPPVARALLLLAALGPVQAMAQPPQPPEERQRDRARTFLTLRLADVLNLSDDKALQLSGIIRKTDEQRHQLQLKRREVEAKLRAALDKSPPDQAALGTLISEANDIDQQLATVPEQTFREAQKILTVEQQAKLLLFRPQLQNQVRGAMRRRSEAERDRPRRLLGRLRGEPLE